MGLKKLATRLRIATLNVGSMTGKGRQLTDVLNRRRIYIACVQETRWKGSKAKQLGEGYKLYYHGDTTKRNGIGIIVSQKCRDNLLNVNRITYRIMALQLVIAKGKMNVLSVYTPQTGCTDEDKDNFWKKLDEVLQSIPANEKVILACDMSGHVGADRSGVERWHGCHGYGSQNEEGRTIRQCAQMCDLAIAKTFFEKKTNI